MAGTSNIQWTDSTWNPWWGCQKVGPGCDHCYAEGLDKRTGGSHWGPGAERRRTSESNWNEPLRWQKKADQFEAVHGRRRRVFSGSMMDFLDNAVPNEWAIDAFSRIKECDRLDWQLLTKRIGNLPDRIPFGWAGNWPKHVGVMITVVDQKEADRDIPRLLDFKARWDIPWVGLSMEPLLGPVDVSPFFAWGCSAPACPCKTDGECADVGVDWVITGGESGPHARPSNPQWFMDLRDQCADAGVPFFFKQWGEWCSVSEAAGDGRHHKFDDGRTVRRIGVKHDPHTLDGVEHNAFPEVRP